VVIAELIPICARFGGLWCRRSGTDGLVTLSDDEIVSFEFLKHSLKLTNMGRTPAHILSYQIYYSCLDKGVTSLSGRTVIRQGSTRIFDHLAGGAPFRITPQVQSGRVANFRVPHSSVFEGCGFWPRALKSFARNIRSIPFLKRYKYVHTHDPLTSP
jgi:hypothetical protein